MYYKASISCSKFNAFTTSLKRSFHKCDEHMGSGYIIIYILAFTNLPKKINNSKLKLRNVPTYYDNAKKIRKLFCFPTSSRASPIS